MTPTFLLKFTSGTLKESLYQIRGKFMEYKLHVSHYLNAQYNFLYCTQNAQNILLFWNKFPHFLSKHCPPWLLFLVGIYNFVSNFNISTPIFLCRNWVVKYPPLHGCPLPLGQIQLPTEQIKTTEWCYERNWPLPTGITLFFNMLPSNKSFLQSKK